MVRVKGSDVIRCASVVCRRHQGPFKARLLTKARSCVPSGQGVVGRPSRQQEGLGIVCSARLLSYTCVATNVGWPWAKCVGLASTMLCAGHDAACQHPGLGDQSPSLRTASAGAGRAGVSAADTGRHHRGQDQGTRRRRRGGWRWRVRSHTVVLVQTPGIVVGKALTTQAVSAAGLAGSTWFWWRHVPRHCP